MKPRSHRRFNAAPRPARARHCIAGRRDRASYDCQRSDHLKRSKAPCKQTHVRAKGTRKAGFTTARLLA